MRHAWPYVRTATYHVLAEFSRLVMMWSLFLRFGRVGRAAPHPMQSKAATPWFCCSSSVESVDAGYWCLSIIPQHSREKYYARENKHEISVPIDKMLVFEQHFRTLLMVVMSGSRRRQGWREEYAHMYTIDKYFSALYQYPFGWKIYMLTVLYILLI